MGSALRVPSAPIECLTNRVDDLDHYAVCVSDAGTRNTEWMISTIAGQTATGGLKTRHIPTSYDTC